MIATITLNPSIDQNIIVEHLVKDDANRALRIERDPGGKGLNVSKVVHGLGGRTHAYALVGGLPGQIWKDLVHRQGIPFTAVPVSGDLRINIILTDIHDRTQTRVSAPGPRVSKTDIRKLSQKLLTARPRPFLWALGGSLPGGVPAGTYRDLIRILQKNSAPCILDTDNEALRLGIDAKPFMIKPNEFEMRRLTGKNLKSVGDYLSQARLLVRKGVKIVIVSLAARGALFVTAAESFHVSTPQVKVVTRVGAGDSLIGGVALGLYRRRPLKEAARLGVAASTSAIMTGGTSFCRAADIPGLLRRIKVTPL